MATDKKISELGSASAFTGVEKFELVQGGLNVAGTPEQMKTYVGAGPTREFDRAFSSELLFDKNYIEGVLHTQTADITFTVAETGALLDQESVYGQRIVLDGVNAVFFQGFNHVANIASGDVLDAGTYQFIFWYSNGIARASIMLPRQEIVLLTPLATPTNFAADVGYDPDTEIYLSWTAVPNVSSYEIQYSATGGSGPWIALTNPVAAVTAYIHTSLTPNTTYHYRIRAIGDLVTFSNSQYAVTATTTSDAGDITAPTFISSPANAATGIVVNKVVVITANEALRDADGVTEITNANILDYLTAVNSTAGAQSITATIDASKTVITITPNVVWDEIDDITITLDGVEDVNGNSPAAFAFTFTTSDYTEMEGNHMSLGTQIDSFIVGADKNWEIEVELNNLFLDVAAGFIQKHAAGQESYSARIENNDGFFKYYRRAGITLIAREITWPDAFLGFVTGKVAFKYFGAVDTNNGLDRVGLFIDDVEVTTGKAISVADGAFPFDVSASPAAFMLRGPAFREARNFKIKTDMGATTVVNIPIVRTGTDISGNSFDGTWI